MREFDLPICSDIARIFFGKLGENTSSSCTDTDGNYTKLLQVSKSSSPNVSDLQKLRDLRFGIWWCMRSDSSP